MLLYCKKTMPDCQFFLLNMLVVNFTLWLFVISFSLVLIVVSDRKNNVDILDIFLLSSL